MLIYSFSLDDGELRQRDTYAAIRPQAIILLLFSHALILLPRNSECDGIPPVALQLEFPEFGCLWSD